MQAISCDRPLISDRISAGTVLPMPSVSILSASVPLLTRVALTLSARPLGELLIVLVAAHPVGMPFDDDGLDARAGRELRDHVAIQTRFRRGCERSQHECENLLVLESHRGVASRGGDRRGSRRGRRGGAT